MGDQSRQYGILLPHFGQHATRERIVGHARRIEQYGFDSVWVRDHIVFHPHRDEGNDRTFVDPFVALSAIAVVTERLVMGTASLIPHRHPLHAALLLASLDFLAGPDRLIAGWGVGNWQHEFDAIGMTWDRRELLQEQVEIFRKVWTGETVSHQGKHYQFADVDIHPTPASGSIPIWYCGSSKAAARRAVEYCEGWLPGRMPLRDFRERMERMRRLADEAGKPVPHAGTVPYVSPGRSMEDALQRVNVPAILDEVSVKPFLRPASGRFETLEDLDAAVIVGPPNRIVEEVRRSQEAGGLHFVFDLRLRFWDWEDALQLIAEEVLPELRRGDPVAVGAARTA